MAVNTEETSGTPKQSYRPLFAYSDETPMKLQAHAVEGQKPLQWKKMNYGIPFLFYFYLSKVPYFLINKNILGKVSICHLNLRDSIRKKAKILVGSF